MHIIFAALWFFIVIWSGEQGNEIVMWIAIATTNIFAILGGMINSLKDN